MTIAFRLTVIPLIGLGILSCTSPSPRDRIEDRGIEFSEGSFIEQAAQGNQEVVELFLDAGIAIDARDENQMTAVMRAAEKGHSDVAHLLAERGAKLNLEDRLGQTALDYASEDPSTGIFADLASRGALYGKLKRDEKEKKDKEKEAEAKDPSSGDH